MTLRFLADENFNGKVLRGLRARSPLLDILRWQDIGPEGVDDPVMLQWAATQKRVLLTHDAETMAGYAYERIEAGLPMSGVIVVHTDVAFRVIIEDLMLVAEASFQDEYEGRVIFVPL